MAQQLFATVLGAGVDGGGNEQTRVAVYNADGTPLWSFDFVDEDQAVAKARKPVKIDSLQAVYATDGGTALRKVTDAGIEWATTGAETWGGTPADLSLDLLRGYVLTLAVEKCVIQRHFTSSGALDTDFTPIAAADDYIANNWLGDRIEADADGVLYLRLTPGTGDDYDIIRVLTEAGTPDWFYAGTQNTGAELHLIGVESDLRAVFFNEHDGASGTYVLRRYAQDGTEYTAGSWPIVHASAEAMEGTVAQGDCLFVHETAITNELRAYEFDGTLRWAVPSPVTPISTSYEAGGGVGVVHVRDDTTGEVVAHKFDLSNGSEITADSWPITIPYADGNSYNRPTHWATVEILPPVVSTLEVTLDTNVAVLDVNISTLWPMETVLLVALSTDRGAGSDASAILPVSYTTTVQDDAEMQVLLDVVAPDGIASSLPSLAQSVTGSIQERVGGGVTASLEREDGSYPGGGSASLRQVQAMSGGGQRTITVSRRVATAPYGRGYMERGGVPVRSLVTPSPAKPLQDTILPELVKTPELTDNGVQMVNVQEQSAPPLYGLDLELGYDIGVTEADCEQKEAEKELLENERQTRRQIARAAVAEAGMSLVVRGSIPNQHRKVAKDYTTKGQTAASVLSDMLLASSPRVWYAPGAVYVDGRTFSGGASTDPTAFIAKDDLADDGASWNDQPGSNEPEPLLADYTDRCERKIPRDESDDPDADGTFETFETGSYTWTVRSGAAERTSVKTIGGGTTQAEGVVIGGDYQEVEHTLTKEGGRLISELEVTKAYYRPHPNEVRFGVVARTEVTNEYHPACAEALVRRTEVNMQRKSREDLSRYSAWGDSLLSTPWTYDVNEGFETVDTWMEQGRTTVDQVWHAEGWLLSRTEISREMDGLIMWTDTNVHGDLVAKFQASYRKNARSETYTPVGNGLWRIATTVRSSVHVPVYEPLAPDAEPDGTHYREVSITGAAPAPVSNTYVVITDQAPPQVSCETDPCDDEDPYDKCIREATEQWEIDHADWRARQAHNGPKRVWRLEANRLLPGIRVGQTLGGGFVASVSHQQGYVEGSTSIEVWQWLS